MENFIKELNSKSLEEVKEVKHVLVSMTERIGRPVAITDLMDYCDKLIERLEPITEDEFCDVG